MNYSSNKPWNWDAIRRQVYRRDNYTCQDCGTKNTKLNAHHRTPRSEGGTDDLYNLDSLCDYCHEDIHPWLKKKRDYSTGYEKKYLWDEEEEEVAYDFDAPIYLNEALWSMRDKHYEDTSLDRLVERAMSKRSFPDFILN